MERKDFENYLLAHKYLPANRSTYRKTYLITKEEADTPDNNLTIEYKIVKEIVYVYYVSIKGRTKRMKARLKNLGFGKDGELVGFKVI